MSSLEIFAFIFNVLGVWLTSKQYKICWLVNMIAVLLYAVLFYQVNLYSDAMLQGIFFILQFYGWYKWNKLAKFKQVTISNLPVRNISYYTITGIFLAIVLGHLTSTYTIAILPWLDSALASFSIIASIWAAKKYIES